jgi:predicted O-methyltransferase YrrM
MRVNLRRIKELARTAKREPATGNSYVDGLYESVVPIIGHTTPYYRLFWLLTKVFEPVNIVELGSWRGIAAAHFAVEGANVITIDIHKDPGQEIDEEHCWDVVQHMPNVTHLVGWTWGDDIVAKVGRLAQPIDILYIDAWHTYEFAKREWDLYVPMCSDEALIICDDIMDADGATESMVKFWEEIPYEKFLDNDMHNGVPMGFVRFVR